MDVFTSNLRYEDFEDIYLVSQLMESDLSEVVRTQKLTDEHVQFLVYQILRGLKVKIHVKLPMMIISEDLFLQYLHSAGIVHRVCYFVF